MADPTARELKLVQYLNEAYGKEKQLETTLQAQIGIMQKQTVKKRLQEHLKETKAQSRGLERRIKALGGKAETTSVPGPDIAAAGAGAVANVANRALAAAKGPVQALRGTSAADNQLRNARDCYWNEAEEIAHYNVIEAAADQLGDKETVKLAREFRRQEQRMQTFLEKQIPQLVREVIKEEIPARDRKPASASSSRSGTRKSASSRSGTRKASSGTRKSSSSKSSSSRSTSRSSGSGTTSRKASSSKSSGSGSRGKSSTSSRASASRTSSRSAPKTATRGKTTGSANGRSASSRSKSSGSSGSGSGSKS